MRTAEHGRLADWRRDVVHPAEGDRHVLRPGAVVRLLEDVRARGGGEV